MAGDPHKGEPRCLHPQARRAVETNPFGDLAEQCLDCRARRRQFDSNRRMAFGAKVWGPWISAGEQVKRALLAQEFHETQNELYAWVKGLEKKQ